MNVTGDVFEGMSAEELAEFEQGLHEWEKETGQDEITDEKLEDMRREYEVNDPGFSGEDEISRAVRAVKSGEALTANDIRNINKAVSAKWVSISEGYQYLESVRFSQDYYEGKAQDVVSQENMQELPAYAQADMAYVQEDVCSTLEMSLRQDKSELFDAVYSLTHVDKSVYGRDSILTQDTVSDLGQEYQDYEAEKFEQYLDGVFERNVGGVRSAKDKSLFGIDVTKGISQEVPQRQASVEAQKPAEKAVDNVSHKNRGHEFDHIVDKAGKSYDKGLGES